MVLHERRSLASPGPSFVPPGGRDVHGRVAGSLVGRSSGCGSGRPAAPGHDAAGRLRYEFRRPQPDGACGRRDPYGAQVLAPTARLGVVLKYRLRASASSKSIATALPPRRPLRSTGSYGAWRSRWRTARATGTPRSWQSPHRAPRTNGRFAWTAAPLTSSRARARTTLSARRSRWGQARRGWKCRGAEPTG